MFTLNIIRIVVMNLVSSLWCDHTSELNALLLLFEPLTASEDSLLKALEALVGQNYR